MALEMPSNCPFPGSQPNSTSFVGRTRVHTPNGISVGSAVSDGRDQQTDRQTHTHTQSHCKHNTTLYSIRSRAIWTAKKTNEWVLNKAGVKRELLDTVKAVKVAYYGHTMRKHGSYLEKQIMSGTMPGARRRGRLHTAWMDNIKTWTGLPVEESVRMTEDRDNWRKYVHGVANPRIEDC